MNTEQFSDSDITPNDTVVGDHEPNVAHPARPGAHPFDPISAVLGLLACLAGALVVSGTVDPVGADGAGLWVAGAVISIGVALLPWGRTSHDH